MVSLLHSPGGPGYRGLTSLWEYVNADGVHPAYNCGQAAAATALTWAGCLPPRPETMLRVESEHPPDVCFGWLGTSRGRVERACLQGGLTLTPLRGEHLLRVALTQRLPCLVAFDTPGPAVWGLTLPGGHWSVAYGYDKDCVYLTNYGPMFWHEFARRRRGLVTWLAGMSGVALAARV